jgi:hypothetical protein
MRIQRQAREQQQLRRRGYQTTTKAMVNVDVSPSVILGVGLIGSGVSLWQIRQSKPWISKDYDVVISCISLLVGGILIFQGWRLDPLLLFGQLMTTGAALSFAVEALRLRNEVYEQEEREALGDAYRFRGSGGGNGRRPGNPQQLPPPEADYGYQQYEREGEYAYYDGDEEEYGDSRYYIQGDDDVRVYDTTVGGRVEAEAGAGDTEDGYGFGSIGYSQGDVDDATEALYNSGSRGGLPPFVDLGDDDDF